MANYSTYRYTSATIKYYILAPWRWFGGEPKYVGQLKLFYVQLWCTLVVNFMNGDLDYIISECDTIQSDGQITIFQ